MRIVFQAMVNGEPLRSPDGCFVDARTGLVNHFLRLATERAIALGGIEDYVTDMWDAVEKAARLTMTDNEDHDWDTSFSIEMVIE